MSNQSQSSPLAEIFGFAFDVHTPEARRYRDHRLCPYHNRVPNCTKDKANDPLGVCSIYDKDGNIALTCPVRFRQDWLIAEHAAAFMFPSGTRWTTLSEVRLNDKNGISAGNIDIVLVAYDDRGHILDFGALEVQAVYISGNVRRLFERYMENPAAYQAADWSKQRQRPRPDYLSSSRKRLVPQLLYKGSILKTWGKRQAVALHRGFYNTLPPLQPVSAEKADIAWLIYDLTREGEGQPYRLTLHQTLYTQFKPALDQITTPSPGDMGDFVETLQTKLDDLLNSDDERNPPDAPTLTDLL